MASNQMENLEKLFKIEFLHPFFTFDGRFL